MATERPRETAGSAAELPDQVANQPRVAGVAARVTGWLGDLRNRYDRVVRWAPFHHRYAPWVGLLAAVVTASAVVGWVWGLRYWAFQTSAWDLGVYFQGMYTAWFNHRLFYYTNDLPAGTNGYVFAAHFSPFLFLLLPPFALAPTPAGLLALQAIGLAAGAIPVYFLARLKLGSGSWGALFAGLYLLWPLTMGTGWFDFHPEAFLPATALTAFYFYERRRLYPFLAAWLLTLSVVETIAPFLILFGAATLAVALWSYWRGPSSALREEIKFASLGIVLAGAWYGLSALVVLSLNQSGGTFGSSYGQAWSILGAQSILGVFPRALLDPSAAAAALGFDAGPKLLYLALMLGTFVFLPLVGRWQYLFPAVAWIALALLSNDYAYYVINDQYVAYALPFLIPATITGILWLRRVHFGWQPRRLRGPVIAALLVVALVSTSAVASPFLVVPLGSFNSVPHGIPTLTAHDQVVHQVIGLIPPGAGVLTTSRLFPEVADRPNAYVSPVASLFLGNLTFQGVVAGYLSDSEFVLVDYQVDFTGAVVLLSETNLTGFGLEAAAQGAYLYARGWTGAPLLWVPYSFSTAGGYLTPELARVDHTVTTPLGPTMFHPASSGPGTVWQGPGLETIPPGQYRISALVELVATMAGPTGGFAVLNDTIGVQETVTSVGSTGHAYHFLFLPPLVLPVVVSNQTMSWNGSGSPAALVNWSSVIHWTGPGLLETRGFALSAGISERLYWLTIVQLSPS